MVARKIRHTIGCIGVGIALCHGGLGLVITFVPGAEAWWFARAACAAGAGLLSPNWRVRLAGVALAVEFLWLTWLGYQRGQEYQRWLQENGLATLSATPDRGNP